jgi:hypothetical protein
MESSSFSATHRSSCSCAQPTQGKQVDARNLSYEMSAHSFVSKLASNSELPNANENNIYNKSIKILFY